jgi:hypothetical protein
MLYHIDIIGIVIAAVAYMIIGGLWYSPYLFGKRWMTLVGWPENMSPEEKAAKKKSANRAMGFNFVAALVMAFALERIIYNVALVTFSQNLTLAFLLWLGFTAATNITEYLYTVKPRPWELFFINQGLMLVATLLMAVILYFI